MLDDDDESIVLLDTSLRRTRRMVILDAWKSFNRASRTRVWKIGGRTFIANVVIVFLGEAILLPSATLVQYECIWPCTMSKLASSGVPRYLLLCLI